MLISSRNPKQADAQNPSKALVEATGKVEPAISNTLQGWKEIAAYMKRGIRTVQRWEESGGLPVRRAGAGDRSAVFAFPDELDNWLHLRTKRKPD